MTARTTLILGGARSGKTSRALALCEPFAERYYIATAEALDEEMSARIAAHKNERGDLWKTVEAPLSLADALRSLPTHPCIAVVDCLTLWLSNLMGANRNIEKTTGELCETIISIPAHLVLVSNEVGLGLVPDTALGRTFRDHQGRINQAVAAVVDRVDFVAAGLPMRLK
jgi:adenosylcobinamide kinase/adenosylcobinamide-phosphate guanylyltransferase